MNTVSLLILLMVPTLVVIAGLIAERYAARSGAGLAAAAAVLCVREDQDTDRQPALAA